MMKINIIEVTPFNPSRAQIEIIYYTFSNPLNMPT
jgi:hypothetical protein